VPEISLDTPRVMPGVGEGEAQACVNRRPRFDPVANKKINGLPRRSASGPHAE
jgi:hypothetical protein